MLDRLCGLETEYAIRFSPEDGETRPDTDTIFRAVSASVDAIVHTRPGGRRWLHKQIFTQNGGSLYKETNGISDGGLIEAGTPECRGPSQLLLYQRAHDALLARALPSAQRRLGELGFPGTLGLLKNCRDADGQIYGAQENYEAVVATGPMLAIYRVGTALILPLVVASILMVLALSLVVLGLMLAAIPVAFAGMLVGSLFIRDFAQSVEGWRPPDKVIKVAAKVAIGLEASVWSVAFVPSLWLLKLTTHRPFRRDALAFLLTRQVFSGAGTLVAAPETPDTSETGTLHLSEKGVALTGVARIWPTPTARVVFDPGNITKVLQSLALGRVRPVLRLFHRRQRMQLGLADANMAEWAEFLRLGTTLLMLDMAEDGALTGMPRLRRPVRAHRALNADASLTTQAETVSHGPMTALEIQRAYLARAETYVADAVVTSVEARQVVRMWRETLDALATDPDALFGKVDWVTKRVLLRRAAEGASWAVQKKVDLRYHELGTGYFDALGDADLVTRITDDADIAHAIATPPRETPAWTRGRLVHRLATTRTDAAVSWDSVRVRGKGRKVVYLSDRRPGAAERLPEDDER